MREFSIRGVLFGASLVTLGNLFTALFNFLQSVCIARFLGPSQFGTLGIIYSTTYMIRGIIGFRTQDPLTRHLVEYRQSNDLNKIQLLLASTLSVDFATGIGAFLAITLVAPFQSVYVAGGASLLPFYVLFGLTSIFSFADLTASSLAREQCSYFFIGGIPAILSGIQCLSIGFLAFTNHLHIQEAVYIATFLSGLQAYFSLKLIGRYLDNAFSIRIWHLPFIQAYYKRNELSEFWKFMKNSYISTTVSSFAKNGDIMILGYFRSDAEAGYFRLAKSLAGLVQILAGPLTTFIFQDWNELIRSGRQTEIRSVLKGFLRWWLPLNSIILLVCLFSADSLLSLVYGEAFRPASSLFMILAIAGCLTIMFFWAQPLLLAYGMHEFNRRLVVWICGIAIFAMGAGCFLGGSKGLSLVILCMWSAIYLGLVLKVYKTLPSRNGVIS